METSKQVAENPMPENMLFSYVLKKLNCLLPDGHFASHFTLFFLRDL